MRKPCSVKSQSSLSLIKHLQPSALRARTENTLRRTCNVSVISVCYTSEKWDIVVVMNGSVSEMRFRHFRPFPNALVDVENLT